jgi:predicted amidohydrolase
MRAAFVQFQPEFGLRKLNIDKALAMMKSEPAELYVLPELFSSGYVFLSSKEVENLAEIPGKGETFKAIADFTRSNNCAAVFGFPEKAPEGFYNSSLFVGPDGHFKLYRKLHLFFEEKKYFLPGNLELEVFDYREARIGMMICYDWIYPEVARILALKGANLICHSVNLVMSYCQDSMITRSIENRVYTIPANRIGEEKRDDKGFLFTGKSQITDCSGTVLYRASENKEEIFAADIEIEKANDKSMNALNNLWADRRIEYYKRLGEK